MRIAVVCCALTVAIHVTRADERPRLHPLGPQARNAKTGPDVGARIPYFEAVDGEGQRRTFESLRGPKGLVLAIDRSADWCASCKAQLIDLNQRVDEFRQRGLAVASLTYDSVAVLRHFAERKRIRYTLLSDPESKAIRAFGLFNFNIEPSNPAYGIAFPGVYIIDERGVVRAKFFEDDNTERYSAASMLTREFGADGVEKTSVDTPQLKLTSSASDSAFAPGQRITLILDMYVKPGMHVYAPGIEGGYIPIEWRNETTKSWIVYPVTYAAPRMLRLEAIGETVPVYTGHTRLIRDITIGQEAEIAPVLKPDRTLSVEGVFRYQACDSKECYPPRSIPLQWTFRIGQRDSQRVPVEFRRDAR